MSAFTDLLLSSTDPVNALMLIGLTLYVRGQFRTVRDRVNRLENVYIPDGGETEER